MSSVLYAGKNILTFRQPPACEIWRSYFVKMSSLHSKTNMRIFPRRKPTSVVCGQGDCLGNLRSTTIGNTHSYFKFRSFSTLGATEVNTSVIGFEPRAFTRHVKCMSSHNPISVPIAASGTAVTKDESREFMAVFPDLVRDLTDPDRKTELSPANKWFSKVLQYNVPGGKKNRGLAVVFSFKMLASKEQLTPENIRKAQILGWCVELLQAFLLVVDDVMDNAVTRRGRPCWYRHNNLGVTAINDAILIESGIYTLLKKYCQNEPYYVTLLEVFHDITMKTCLGQSLDLLCSQSGQSKPDYNTFTMDRYNAIVKYKAGYYSFYLPVVLAMYMTGYKDPEVLRQAKTILIEMGQFFQVQDDFLDCFGDPEVTGKIGTDIEDGKCSWLAVVALQRASPEQKQIFIENYGSKDVSKVAVIKSLYEQLGLRAMFSVYEEESYHLIITHIQQLSRGMPHNLFFKFLEKIYKRES